MQSSPPQELYPAIVTFGRFRLDAERAELTCDGKIVPLRPKVYLLLRYLAANAGRTLSKQQLMASVWPDVVVTDDSLSQCINELRAALGESGRDTVKTISRLGYRFDLPAAPQQAPSQIFASIQAANATPGAAAAAAAVAGSESAGVLAATPKFRSRAGWAISAAVLLAVALGIGWSLLRATPRGIDEALVAARSITVIPFVDQSEPQASASYFAEGVSGEIIAGLGSLQGALVVASGGEAAAIAAVDIQGLGRRLGVQHVLTGSVRREGEKVQVQVQLSRTDNAALEWSRRFDYPSAADWNWRGDVAQLVAASLDARLLDGVVEASGRERNGTAVDEWMRGEYWLRHHTNRSELLEARRHFEAALAADPRSVNALVGLARTHIEEVIGRWASDRHTTLDLAKSYARQAIAIDPNHGPSLIALGAAYAFDNQFDAAYPLYQKALQVMPNSAQAHFGMASVLMFSGRFAEVEPHARTALRLDPLNARLAQRCHASIGQALMAQQRADEALAEFRMAEAAAPSLASPHFMIAAAEARRGNMDEARRELAEGLRLSPSMTVSKSRALSNSEHPRYIAGLSWMYEGLRLAGLPEGELVGAGVPVATR